MITKFILILTASVLLTILGYILAFRKPASSKRVLIGSMCAVVGGTSSFLFTLSIMVALLLRALE